MLSETQEGRKVVGSRGVGTKEGVGEKNTGGLFILPDRGKEKQTDDILLGLLKK